MTSTVVAQNAIITSLKPLQIDAWRNISLNVQYPIIQTCNPVLQYEFQKTMLLHSCGNAIVQFPNQCVTIPNNLQASMRSFQVIPINVAHQFSAILPPAHLLAVPDQSNNYMRNAFNFGNYNKIFVSFDGKKPLGNGAFGVVW